MEQIVNGTDGGRHIAGAPLTTTLSDAATPELLRRAIDERIATIRPMSTPIDQITRSADSRRCKSMQVEYYSVDTKKQKAILKSAASNARKIGEAWAYDIVTDDNAIFDVSETILAPGIIVNDSTREPLMLYVQDKSDTALVVVPINGTPDSEGIATMPSLMTGTMLVRMGRAAAELDVQSPQFSAMPKKARNNCQIFKMQVEQSTLQKIADKEVDWLFSDQEEAAIIDMRQGMEKSFLFGAKCRLLNPTKNEYIYFTGGIWNQCDPTNDYTLNEEISEATLIDICARAFDANTGSRHKILLAGSDLLQKLSNVERSKVFAASETRAVYGLEFNEIRSNFGTLMVMHSEVFDQCNHSGDGMIIDPDYITKYVHIPFNVETLDLRRSGQRNTEAVVITEASCLVLRYPKAHLRIISI